MNNIYKTIIAALLVLGTACTDLDVPPGSRISAENAYRNLDNYEAVLAKIYASFSTTGQTAINGTGDADLVGIDEGASSYIRLLWKLQELPTDEAVIGWNDATIQDFNVHAWGDQDGFLRAMYARLFFQISIANEFIRESTEEALDSRGFTEEEKTTVRRFKAEARFVRAFTYFQAMDLFGNISFFDETAGVASPPPARATSDVVFAYIDSELQAIEGDMAAPRAARYGHADRGALWALQAKLYLNAPTYLGAGQTRYDECIAACNKILAAGVYDLAPVYRHNFLADNDLSEEIIFAATFDGIGTRTFGGTTFLVNASIGGQMVSQDYGTNEKWAGLRATGALVDLFEDGPRDSRYQFFTTGQNKDINSLGLFTDGFALPKYVNVTSDGEEGKSNVFADVDFPFFRLADTYLTYAEAVLRGGSGGDRATALNYINALRRRAYANDAGNIDDTGLTLAFILDERGRELHWEAHRRTDLIRFGQFSSNKTPAFANRGTWPWKGGTQEGQFTEAHRDLYPIPVAELLANPNLKQNDGY